MNALILKIKYCRMSPLLLSLQLSLLLAACASYAPQPLPTVPAGMSEVQQLRQPHSHRFDPADGLDGDELAMLAVANNPELRAARARLKVARAQVFAAGLLPDPQLNANEDLTMTPQTQNAWALGLGFDVGSWLLRSSRLKMARATQSQVQQELLWQEWQVVAQARLLYARLQASARVGRLLQQEAVWLQALANARRNALASQDATAEMASADTLAWRAVQQQQEEQTRVWQQDMGALHTLLGLDASANIQLSNTPAPSPLDVALLRQQVQQRLQQRPDLVAIRAAYQATEAEYHAEVLAQFPLLSVSVNRAQDNLGDNSVGPGISLSLPLFNRNRGNIAIARANRAQLYAAYQARLDAASNEAMVALDNYPLLERQMKQITQDVPTLRQQVAAATQAYDDGNVTLSDMTRMEMVLLDRRMAVVNVGLALQEQRIALNTLLGANLPDKGTAP